MNNDRLAAYAELIRTHSAQQNLLSAGELERLESRHFKDCATLLSLPQFGNTGRLVDLGSGNGLPGLLLAISCPQLQVTCIEAEKRKTDFLQTVITELPLENAQAVRGRAEDLAHEPLWREQFDVVTARACAAWPIVLELACGWVKPGGLIFLFGSEAQNQQLSTSKVLEKCLLKQMDTHEYQLDAEQNFVIGTFRKGPEPSAANVPRRWAQVSKKPY